MVTKDLGGGVLLALACGDALGEPVEGWSADRITTEYGTLTEFVDGRVPPGGLTDDTAQALRLARRVASASQNEFRNRILGQDHHSNSIQASSRSRIACFDIELVSTDWM